MREGWIGVACALAASACVADELRAHPHDYVLQAPKNVERWEPSAAVVQGDWLWVAGDKPIEAGDEAWGVVAAYDLSALKPWKELRSECVEAGEAKDARKGKCDGNRPVAVRFVPGGEKLEAGAGVGGGATLWWDTVGHRAHRCPASGPACAPDGALGLPGDPELRALVRRATGEEELEYVTVEGFAVRDAQAWIGIRKYKDARGEVVYWTGIVDQAGGLLWGGGRLELPGGDGRPFAVSDLLAVQGGVWVTLSHERDVEKHEPHVANTVDGRLAFLTGGKLTACGDVRIQGKPEAVAQHGGELLLVYDSDLDRKDGGPSDKGTGFPLREDQDYLQKLPVPTCEGPELKVK